MCDFEKRECKNDTSVIRTIISNTHTCNQIIVIHIPHVTASPRPLTAFEASVFHHAIDGIDKLIEKANASGTTVDELKKIFTKQDHTHKVYIRNTKCWAYPLDLTSISPWNSVGHTRRAGVLISPRHAVWARHYSMRVNTTLRFVDKHNNVVERKIMKERSLPADGHTFLHGYDLVVGMLDRDVPSSISFSKVLPRNLTTVRPPYNLRVPVFDTDFEEKALVADLSYESGTMVGLKPPLASSYRYTLYEQKIVGDSGNPVFLVIDNQLVLLFVLTYGGAGSGTSISHHYDAINKIMKDMGSSYQLTEIDLTGYTAGSNTIPVGIGK